jgi:hypothetical protein
MLELVENLNTSSWVKNSLPLAYQRILFPEPAERHATGSHQGVKGK